MSLKDDASLILIPSAYKTGEVLMQKPLPVIDDSTGNYDGTDPAVPTSLDFTRASEATRVNSEGLIEKVRTNYLKYSNFETLGASYWNPYANTLTYSGYENNSLFITAESNNSTKGLSQSSVGSTGTRTFSVYAKAYGVRYVQLAQYYSTSYQQYANFDLIDGVVGDIGTNLLSAGIEDAGSGWYRIYIIVPTAYISGSLQIYLASSLTAEQDPLFIGNEVDGILVRQSQAETSDFGPTDYIPTTSSAVSVGPVSNLPRLDYSGGATCPSLLLEPQRTNLALYSEQFDNAAWTKAAVGSGTAPIVTKNYTTAPDGYNSADRIQFNPSASGASYIYNTASLSFSTYGAFTIYAKSLTGDVQTIIIKFGAFSQTYSVGTEWQRLTYLNFGAGTGNFIIGNGASIGGSIYSSDVALWGAQAEDALYPTSYIPTLGAAVTRVADACYKTGMSSFIGQTEGTLFVDITTTDDITTVSPISISDGSGSNRVLIYIFTETFIATVTAGGSTQAFFTSSTISPNTRYKAALAYKANDFAFYINGEQVGTDTSGTVPLCSKLGFDNGSGGTLFQGLNNQALLFKTRLPNATLASLTTL